MNNLNDLLNEEVLELLDRAAQNRHLNMLRINSLADYKETKLELKKTKIWVKCFRKVAKMMFNKYLNSIKENNRKLEYLIDANKLSKCVDFYSEEVEMYQNTIAEYLAYLQRGHVIDAFLGKERED